MKLAIKITLIVLVVAGIAAAVYFFMKPGPVAGEVEGMELTPFEEYIKIAIRQLESLKRKQKALRAVLDDSKDSPFLSTAGEVDQYILANSKRLLNRVMIYDQGDAHKYNMHAAYLQEILGENAHVLSDFENLILEVSQIGDNATAASTPCLTELTNALRSVRSSTAEAWEQQDQTEPPQQMMMQ